MKYAWFRRCLPRLYLQTIGFFKMRVSGNQGQIMLKRHCGNPNIIFWNRSSLLPESIFHFTIDQSSCTVAN